MGGEGRHAMGNAEGRDGSCKDPIEASIRMLFWEEVGRRIPAIRRIGSGQGMEPCAQTRREISMSRTIFFDRLQRALRIGLFCERHKISTREGIARFTEVSERVAALKKGRREFLADMSKVAALGAFGATVGLSHRAIGAPPSPNIDVGIVGAGIAGLMCADTLRQANVTPDPIIYEAWRRPGGRISSIGDAFGFPGPVNFPGQVVERGGELIDNLHLTIKSLAQEFGLALEDVNKTWIPDPGVDTFYFNGQHVAESVVIDEFRDLVDQMRPDLASLSSEITVDNFTEFDQQIDQMSLREYIEVRHDAGPNVKAAIDVAYTTEYGREIDELSALDFIFFIHIDKRAKWEPFGVFSDERYHVVTGNQGITDALADRQPRAAELEHKLVKARKDGSKIELTFKVGNSTVVRRHEVVVFALPFSTLREVDLDPSLGLDDLIRPGISKLDIINNMVYGTNAKLHVGFEGPFWTDVGFATDGVSWSDLRNHQVAWEVNPTNRTFADAVQVDYSGGQRGAGLNPNNPDHEARLFVTDLNLVFPGALDAAKRTSNNKFLADLSHWPSWEFTKGSYIANQPGYFTTIAGLEPEPVGSIFFAGEHTDSFYEWQGFMEGAANSGIRAAEEVLAAFG
jgi:monoamine oxidase